MARILSDDLPRPRVPVVTYALMAAWTVMWVVQALRPDDGNVVDSSQALACRWGMVPVHLTGGAGGAATDPCVVLSTEHSAWLEVFTAQFLHASWWHLLGNLLFLWVFGPSVEQRLGRVRFLPFALACGYAAFVAEALIDSSSAQPVIGGSGVVAAVLGAYIVLFPRARLRVVQPTTPEPGTHRGLPAWLPIAAWIAYETIAAISQSQSDTAHWVHVVGFALGALLAWPLASRPAPTRQPAPEWVRVAIARNQPEAEMIQGILGDAGIPAYVRRMAGFDVPDYLAGGPRDVMVPGDRALEAHALIDPLDAGDGADPA
jgi:membrane associated rhomboid family serine protease